MGCFNVNLDLGVGNCINLFAEDIQFCFNPSTKKRELEEEMGRLRRIRERLMESVDQEERSNPQMKRTSAVTDWMNDVDKTDTEVATLLDNQSCGCGNRCSDRKIVMQLLRRIDNFKAEKPPPGELVFRNPAIPNAHIQYDASSIVGGDDTFLQICEYLRDNEVHRIGVHGVEGIGKTTILKRIKQEFSKPDGRDFDVIVWVEVSREINYRKIQDDIAKCIFLKLGANESENGRAEAICTILQTNRNKCLFLLDDLWERLDLERIGIPIPNGAERSGKIIITTRSKQVCTDMNAKPIVSVSLLSPNESTQLFQRNYIRSDGDPYTQEDIDKVVQKCGGLPKALITVARAVNSPTEIKATQLAITHGDNLDHWKWMLDPSSRSPLVAKLISVWFLEINAEIEKSRLTRETTYGVYLIYKLAEQHYGLHDPYIASRIWVDDNDAPEMRVSLVRTEEASNSSIPVPHRRDDGWLELPLGDFFNDGYGTFSLELADIERYEHLLKEKSGLIIDGMEFRPKR